MLKLDIASYSPKFPNEEFMAENKKQPETKGQQVNPTFCRGKLTKILFVTSISQDPYR